MSWNDVEAMKMAQAEATHRAASFDIKQGDTNGIPRIHMPSLSEVVERSPGSARHMVVPPVSQHTQGATFSGILIDTSSGIVGTGTYSKPPRTFTREEVLAVLRTYRSDWVDRGTDIDRGARLAVNDLIYYFERME